MLWIRLTALQRNYEMLRKVRIGFIILSAFSLGVLLSSGCRVVDQSRVQKEDTDTIPWNTRADWEGTTLGVPY